MEGWPQGSQLMFIAEYRLYAVSSGYLELVAGYDLYHTLNTRCCEFAARCCTLLNLEGSSACRSLPTSISDNAVDACQFCHLVDTAQLSHHDCLYMTSSTRLDDGESAGQTYGIKHCSAIEPVQLLYQLQGLCAQLWPALRTFICLRSDQQRVLLMYLILQWGKWLLYHLCG